MLANSGCMFADSKQWPNGCYDGGPLWLVHYYWPLHIAHRIRVLSLGVPQWQYHMYSLCLCCLLQFISAPCIHMMGRLIGCSRISDAFSAKQASTSAFHSESDLFNMKQLHQTARVLWPPMTNLPVECILTVQAMGISWSLKFKMISIYAEACQFDVTSWQWSLDTKCVQCE